MVVPSSLNESEIRRLFKSSSGFEGTWLGDPSMSKIFHAPDLANRILAAKTNATTVSFLTGHKKVIEISQSDFSPLDDGTLPDLSDIKIEDYGRKIGFGSYEVTSDWVLSKQA